MVNNKKPYLKLILVVNIILYLVLVALWISIPDELVFCLALSVFNLALTLLYIYFDRESLSSLYLSQQFKKYIETIITATLIFCLLGVVNYISFKHPVQLDMTVFKNNSLSEQTEKVLKSIPGKITFKIFARKNDVNLWLPIFERYRMVKPEIEVERVDIDVRPDLVSDYHITNTATLVIEYNSRRQNVTERDELNITNALIKISRSSDPVVYFAIGHDEGDINSIENEGLKYIYEAIRNSAIEIRPINLLTTAEVPFDAKTLIVWGPRTSLHPSEILVIQKFLERKGNLMVALDPDLNTDNQKELRKLLSQYKILLRNNLVIDKKSFVNGSNGSIPLVDTFSKESPLTKTFKGQIFFPLVSSIDQTPDELSQVEGEIKFLTSTSIFPDSWGETNLKEFVEQNVNYTKGKDFEGPLNLAATFESSKNKMVIFGNSTFVINSYLKFANNYAFFLNALSWLVDEDRLISLNQPIIQSEPIFISSPQMGIIFYFCVLFAPLILFSIAVYMYRRRRDR